MRTLGYASIENEHHRIPLFSAHKFEPLQTRLDELVQNKESSREEIYAVQRQIANLANDILEKNYHIPPSSFYLERQRLHEQRNQSVGKKRTRGHNL
jgi:hypothetical protein